VSPPENEITLTNSLTEHGDVHRCLHLEFVVVDGGAAVVAGVLLRQLLDEESGGRLARLLLRVDPAQGEVVKSTPSPEQLAGNRYADGTTQQRHTEQTFSSLERHVEFTSVIFGERKYKWLIAVIN
jgi:hypothetical protein